MSTLAIEFTTGRLLQMVYGTSNLVWANVIGLVLFFLTVGYFIGGRMADRSPQPTLFYQLVCVAGFSSVFFLLLTSVILKTAASAFAALNIGALVGSFIAVVVTLAIPVTLLGCISPFAIRLAVQDVNEAGRVSGRIYAISTWGSLSGTYLPVLWTIPTYGSRVTAVFFGCVLLLVGLVGLWRVYRPAGIVGLLLPMALLPAIVSWTQGSLKTYQGQIYETESAYNYIQVIREGNCNYLLLNEGQGVHSFYCDGGQVQRISVWSLMLAAPYWNNQVKVPQRMAVIGLAAGSIPKQYTQVYGPVAVDGIELDPEIVRVGQEFFALNDPNINVIVGDGRYELNRLTAQYDVITLDAYKVPYIPWHLTTQEFFGEVKARLTGDGVVAINVGRAPQDRRLVDAITTTLSAVFPSVHVVEVPGTLNTIVFATVQPTTAETFTNHVAQLPSDTHPLLQEALETAVTHIVPLNPSDITFTDERAPVETIVDSLVLRYLLDEGPSGLPGFSGQ